MEILFYILCSFLLLKILRRKIRAVKIYFFKKKIEKNHLIGIKDWDGTYLYKKDGYTLRYRPIIFPSGNKQIQWVSYKYRLTPFEEFSDKIKRFFQRLVFYPQLKPFLLFSFALIIIMVYIWIIIPEPKKVRFYKSLLSHMMGIKSEQVEYKGEGWFEIYGKRIIAKDNRTEPITFTFNPWRWLFFSDFGSVTRWLGKKQGGYKTHQLQVEQESRVSIKKEAGRDIHGKIEGDKVKWDRPIGTGSTTQDIEIKEEGIRVIDR